MVWATNGQTQVIQLNQQGTSHRWAYQRIFHGQTLQPKFQTIFDCSEANLSVPDVFSKGTGRTNYLPQVSALDALDCGELSSGVTNLFIDLGCDFFHSLSPIY